MESRINKLATEQTSKFMADKSNFNSTPPAKMERDQVYLVFKFLNSPIDMLVSGMVQMQPTQLIQFFRKLARQLHPDKNCHPNAKDAF